MSRNVSIAIIVVAVVIVAGWFLTRPKQTAILEVQPTQAPISTESASPSSATEGAQMSEEKNNVTITASGFSPKEIIVKVGEAVTWMNSDSIDHTVNSVPHPTHTSYPPLNLDAIKPGKKKSLTFPKAGTYKYHNHLNSSLTGSVTVQ